MAETIGQVLGAAAEVLQTLSQGKQAFSLAKEVLWDPLTARPSDNVEENRDGLDKAVQGLRSQREVFENEVMENKMRRPSSTYVIWRRRVMEIEEQVRVLIAKYNDQNNQGTRFYFFSPCQDFREDMKKMYEKVINLLQESNEIKDKIFVNGAAEPIIKRKVPDIRKYETLQKPLENILDWLKIHRVQGIGIHGIAGIGKTTVLLNLKNHDQVVKMFDIVIWLTVSVEGSKENLTREHLVHAIAQNVRLKIAGTSNVDEVATRIAMTLKGKKYLLLLDDVKEYFDLIDIGIPVSVNGSKIVLTTRLNHVCDKRWVDREIKLVNLSEDEAWKMFRDVLGREDLILDYKIGRTAWRLCNECSGLPLLIEKVANTFKLKNTESLWSDGLNSWRMWPRQEWNGIKELYELLRFCFDDLGDDRYKKCFLYSALYPEDSEINIDSLLECWAAEGFLGVAKEERNEPVVIRDIILSRLKNVSFLEEGESGFHVTMHKFIRHMALYISEDIHGFNHLVVTKKRLREPSDEGTWRKKNRISLVNNQMVQLPDSPRCSILSTLFLQENLSLKTIPPAFFKRMRKLQVLDLSHTGITSLPSSLSALTTLKVLHLNDCEQLEELPSHIMKLVHLESLDTHRSGIPYIPPHVEKLKVLKRLWVSLGHRNDARGLSFNYDIISKLSGLEDLVIDVESPLQWTNRMVENIMQEVAKLPKFKRLTVCFSNRYIDVVEVKPKNVRILVPKAKILTDYISTNWQNIDSFDFFICQNLEYSQNTSFVRYNKYVKYCNGSFDGSTSISGVLAEANAFELVNHVDIKQLSDFGTASMNMIQGCLVEGCSMIEHIMDTVGSELLPNLEQLFVKNLPMLKSIWRESTLQPGRQTKLTKLVLSGCQILDKIFPPGTIQQLREIRYLKIEKCDNVEEIITEADCIGNLPVLPKLEKLILLEMTKLGSICANESLDWPSLEKLEIFKCQGLPRLPFIEGKTANLKRVKVEQEWWEGLDYPYKEWLQKLCIFRSHGDAAQ